MCINKQVMYELQPCACVNSSPMTYHPPITGCLFISFFMHQCGDFFPHPSRFRVERATFFALSSARDPKNLHARIIQNYFSFGSKKLIVLYNLLLIACSRRIYC